MTTTREKKLQRSLDENQKVLKQNRELTKQIQTLTEQVAYLTRKLYGSHSEKMTDPNQLSLFANCRIKLATLIKNFRQ